MATETPALSMRNTRKKGIWRTKMLVRCKDCGKDRKIARRASTQVPPRCKSCQASYAASVGQKKRRPTSAFYLVYPEYRAWQHAKSRCQNLGDKKFSDYGGRGISFCERWNNFWQFLADMRCKPDPSYTLDRIDVNGNYEPNNCRWASPQAQAWNKRNSRSSKYFLEQAFNAWYYGEHGDNQPDQFEKIAAFASLAKILGHLPPANDDFIGKSPAMDIFNLLKGPKNVDAAN